MFPRMIRAGEKNTLDLATGKERLINYYVYMLLTERLKIVKKMLLSPTQGRTPTPAERGVGVIHRR